MAKSQVLERVLGKTSLDYVLEQMKVGENVKVQIVDFKENCNFRTTFQKRVELYNAANRTNKKFKVIRFDGNTTYMLIRNV